MQENGSCKATVQAGLRIYCADREKRSGSRHPPPRRRRLLMADAVTVRPKAEMLRCKGYVP